MCRCIFSLLAFLISLPALTAWAQTANPPSAIDPNADRILKQMSQCLAQTPRFSVKAEKLIDFVLETGQKIQLSSTTRAVVDRPGKLWARTTGDTGTEQAWYADKRLAILNEENKNYAQIDVPDTIDKMMDDLVRRFGWSMPLADLLLSDPYQSAMEKVRVGQYLGLHVVNETKCHHLAFRQEGLDWQIWIDAGPRPLPRKLVITDKESPGHPQFMAILDDWNLSPKIPDDQFTFKAPEGAVKVEVESLRQPATPAAPAPAATK
jgi:hypothetical protein